MTRRGGWVVALACLAAACGEEGTRVGLEGGASDAGAGHDVAFVLQQNATDAGDAATAQDSTTPPEGGGDAPAEASMVQLAAPTFSPPPGLASAPEPVAIVSPPGFPDSGVLRYTTDGGTPGDQSAVYTGPISVGGAACSTKAIWGINAIATAPGYADSPVARGQWFGEGAIPPPTFTPSSESANNDVLVSVTNLCQSTLCYTLDGTPPTCNMGTCTGLSHTYDGAAKIGIDGTVTDGTTGYVTVTAMGCIAGWASGPTQAQLYQLVAAVPTMTNPGPGPQPATPGGVSPTLATTTVSSTVPVSIHMTTDGTPPSCASGAALPGSSAVGPFTSNTTVRAIACKAGYLPSNVVTFVYTF